MRRRTLVSLLGSLVAAIALAVLAGCATPTDPDVPALAREAPPPPPKAGDTVVCFATLLDLRPAVAPAKPGLPPSGAARLKLQVYQLYTGELALGPLTCTVDDVAGVLPADALAPTAKGEYVIMATLVRGDSGWQLTAARGPDLSKWTCWECGRTLQGFKFPGKAYHEERYFCPIHGHRDTRLEEVPQ